MTGPDDRRLRLALLEELAELEQRAALTREHERGRAMAELIEMEDRLQALIADPGPAARRGQLTRDSGGQPLPNEAVRRQAEKTLEQVRCEWARLTGEAM